MYILYFSTAYTYSYIANKHVPIVNLIMIMGMINPDYLLSSLWTMLYALGLK